MKIAVGAQRMSTDRVKASDCGVLNQSLCPRKRRCDGHVPAMLVRKEESMCADAEQCLVEGARGAWGPSCVGSDGDAHTPNYATDLSDVDFLDPFWDGFSSFRFSSFLSTAMPPTSDSFAWLRRMVAMSFRRMYGRRSILTVKHVISM